MAENTKIEWTTHSWNPWIGCVKVSPGCKNCYAVAQDRRFGDSHWGPSAPRRMMSEGYWQQPLRWDRQAQAAGVRARVFCASMADVFERLPDGNPSAADVALARVRLWQMISVTPHLDWLLLTKRPENMRRMAPHPWAERWPANVWAGTSVEDQESAARRIPELLRVPARVRFLSCEPLLGPVALADISDWPGAAYWWGKRVLGGEGGLHWVIVGGESGPGARACDVAWVRSLVSQCAAAGVACFVKQLGANVTITREIGCLADFGCTDMSSLRDIAVGETVSFSLHDKKGGKMEEWADDLHVRQFPEASAGEHQ